ncbi:unnamed protein product [Ranitomeya imitator]|uniref:Helix-turn-helix domain-containing protein n=1 Tax=Ranitomeya imitator TaxID=111125 RepID=A0ABN9LWW8_9NEOB|nr:unnamed protein product [Ranitomeya imitator]
MKLSEYLSSEESTETCRAKNLLTASEPSWLAPASLVPASFCRLLVIAADSGPAAPHRCTLRTFSQPDLDAFTAVKDVHLFTRKLVLKRYHEKSTSDGQLDAVDDQQVVAILESLLDEQNPTSIYLQLQGTAMGAACAPSYANLFLGAWERGIFLSDPVVHVDKVHHWIRYIDDVFFIWEGTIEHLNEFMSRLNVNDLNIKLTFSHGRQINFLDLDVFVSPQGVIETNVYRKPTATNTLLHASSSHRQSTINGIPIGQHLRIKRICSSQEQFQDQAQDLYHRFRKCGYSHRQIRKGYKRACLTPRNELLYQTTPKKKDDTQGCKNHIKSKDFSNPQDGRVFKIRHQLTCASKGVIYHAQCPCNKVYIGMTTRELKLRTREHVHDIERARMAKDADSLKTLARHFYLHHECNADKLKIKAIDQVSLGPRGGDLFKAHARV